jgi:hypothetical protein
MNKFVEGIRFTVKRATSLLSTVKLGNARFEVFTAVLLNIQPFWDFQLCRRVNSFLLSEGFYFFRHRSDCEGTRHL